MDHMDDQPHEAIDKVLPCPRFAVEATLQQESIDVGKAHVVAREDEKSRSGVKTQA
ncbi:hypothetical protein RRSWK_02921 [Rhodopirellula sp. SWK7]|nr:hypothetical protein RRSWK_02921 [Rhodopirellula sp. SWK7]